MAKVGSNRIRSLRLTPRGAAVQPALAAWRGRAYAQARGVERERGRKDCHAGPTQNLILSQNFTQ
jgi:hypothetical protein